MPGIGHGGMGWNFLFQLGNPPPEDLDSPENNFDIIGIPTGNWSSSLFGCLENVTPSCTLSFFLPCVMWSQVVVRSQIPLFIALKNGIFALQTPRRSGFGFFVEFFGWVLALAALLLIIALAIPSMPAGLKFLLIVVAAMLLASLALAVGHTRTAFKMK